MKTIKLAGDLGNRFGREYTLDVQTPAEAMRALILQMPEMRS
jgi:predicted phage tail protein